MTDLAEAALLEYPDAGIYVRSGMLVRVLRADGSDDQPGVRKHEWLDRAEGAPVIARVPTARLRELLSDAASWQGFDGRKKTYVQKTVPAEIPATLEARGAWRFPALDGVTDTPVIRADGSIHDRPGYDPATRLIYDPRGVEFPPVPASPDQTEAVRALAALMEPFCDFPFVGESSAVVASAILSLIARPIINGPVPLHGMDATARGTGKSLLVDIATLIAAGYEASRVSPTDSDEEWRKRILTLALEGAPSVLVDNQVEPFGSAALDGALTGMKCTDRILGSTASATASLRAVWFVTGNNLSFRGDMSRRAITCTIDAAVENPEDRTGFRHPDLLDYIRRDRTRLVVAALTVLRAYILAGAPHSLPKKGSFESWDALVRGAILWGGGGDARACETTIRADADTSRAPLRVLIDAWEGAFGAEARTLRDALTFALYTGPAYATETPEQVTDRQRRQALRDALEGMVDGGKVDSRALGNALRRHRGTVVGGRRLVSAVDRDRSSWRVESVR